MHSLKGGGKKMYISALKIHNFRSIKDIEISCNRMVSLLGPNNHGKSNILAALEFALTTAAKPSSEDFFALRDENDNELWVEIAFRDLTEQELTTFNRYALSDGTVRIRKTAKLNGSSLEISYNGWREQPKEAWLQADNASALTTKEKLSSTPLKDLITSSGRITKGQIEEAQAEYIASHRDELSFELSLESGPLLGQRNVAGGVLPEFFLIPAVRDLTDEIKLKANTTFGRLMNRAVREMAQRDKRFADAQNLLENVVRALNERVGETSNELAKLEIGIEKELTTWGVRVAIEVTPPEIEKLFELGTSVQLDDGVRTSADRKGHGLQRALMFALLRAWSDALRSDRGALQEAEVVARKQSDTVIFALEEPELFLHPQAQRRLATSLRAIAETPQHQVLLCTHSTHFVDLSHYREVAIITKQESKVGSCCRQCTIDLFAGDDVAERKKRFSMAHWINPDRSEMFFARRVIFVEGETEKVAFPFIAEKIGVFDPDVSIIDCGSKHSLPLYLAIANAFQIPYLVIHDEDPLPDPIPNNWDEDKVKSAKHTFEQNTKIRDIVKKALGEQIIIQPDFERAFGVPKSQGDKKGKALAALEYFQNKKAQEIAQPLRGIVQQIYG